MEKEMEVSITCAVVADVSPPRSAPARRPTHPELGLMEQERAGRTGERRRGPAGGGGEPAGKRTAEEQSSRRGPRGICNKEDLVGAEVVSYRGREEWWGRGRGRRRVGEIGRAHV